MNTLRTRITLPFFIFVTPVLVWLFLLIVLPHIDLLVMSFRTEDDSGNMVRSLINYLNLFNEPVYWSTFARTAVYAILVTGITVAVSLPVAFFIAKVVSPRYSGVLSLLLLMPFWVSEWVRGYGWMILLRESGVVNHVLIKFGLMQRPLEMLYNDITMVMGLVYTSMLFMMVPFISALERLDDSLIEAAYDLGGNLFSIVTRIIIPHAMPGIVVFMLTQGNYLTPNLIGGKNSLWFTEQIYNQFIASFNRNQGAAFVFLFAPRFITCVLAFNDSRFPARPWKGFTFEWFTADLSERVGLFHDSVSFFAIWVNFKVAFWVAIFSTAVGTCGAFLFEQENFNTTLFLVGSRSTLPITLYLQVRDGSTPVISAISFLLIVGTSMLALINLSFSQKKE